jgi:hypothetical protein
MADLRFEWDPRKDRLNRRKHGIYFLEAESVFVDERGLFMADPEHSEDEDRFVLLGMNASIRLLLVCHCYRESDQVIRIISARKATRSERAQHRSRWRT